MHAFLIFAGRVTVSVSSGFDLVTPRAGRVVFAGFVAITLMGIALVLTLFVRLGQEVFVYVQRTFGFVFLLATYHVFATHGAKALSPALEWYMVALATAGIAAFVYRSLLHNVLVRRTRYTVAAANRLDGSVTEIVLEPRSKPLVYKPGQFVFVSFRSPELRAQQRAVDISLQRQVLSIRAGEISNQFHPFSITSAPAERTLRITVKAIGDYTNALRRLLDEGAEAIVEGPFGSFSNAGLSQPRQIWAAGGIGVTPFLSMARSLGDGGPAVHFYYAVERVRGGALPGRVPGDRGAARRLRGHRRAARARRLPHGRAAAAENPELGSSDVLICGPPAMITNLRAQLVAHGRPERQVHAEEFGFAKRGPRRRRRRSSCPSCRAAAAGVAAARRAVRARVRGVRLRRRRARRPEPVGRAARPRRPDGRHLARGGRGREGGVRVGGLRRVPRPRGGGLGGEDRAEPGRREAIRRGDVIDVVTNGKGVMPGYRGKLTPGQIEQLAAFVSTSTGM